MYADRIAALPPYLFAAIDKAKQRAKEKGIDVIDLGVGDPDLATPEHIVQAMCDAAARPENHKYPSYEGKIEYRKAVAVWYRRTFDVDLDPENEVVALIGSKEGIAHAPYAFINPGDVALVPDPAYTVYRTSVQFAGGVPAYLPLIRENGFLPDIDKIPPDVARAARLIFLNYPNNPTGAVASREFFSEVLDFAEEYDILVMHDNPYSEVYFGGERCPSILEIKGAKERAVEFHSLSKTYNMTGWRIGAVVGNSEIVGGIGKVKSNIDSGVFGAVQDAGIVALTSTKSPDHVAEMRKEYSRRIDILYEALMRAGFGLARPKATFYLWAWVGGDSLAFTEHLLEKVGIVATPGIGFGKYGEGYVRFSVTQPTERIEAAAARLQGLGPIGQ